jgi:hypothetical protein
MRFQALKVRLVGVEEVHWGHNFPAATKTFLTLDCLALHDPEAFESGKALSNTADIPSIYHGAHSFLCSIYFFFVFLR